MQWALPARLVGQWGGVAGAVSEAVHPMCMFLLETPATLALPAPFLDPDSLPTHEAYPSLPFSLLPLSPFQALAAGCTSSPRIQGLLDRGAKAGLPGSWTAHHEASLILASSVLQDPERPGLQFWFFFAVTLTTFVRLWKTQLISPRLAILI